MFIKSFFEKRLRVGLHLLFWTLSYYLLLNVFGYQSEFSKVDYLYCFLFHLFLFPAVYVSIYIILPLAGEKKKWVIYILLNGFIAFILSWLNLRFFNSWSAVFFPGYYFISYLSLLQVAGIISAYISLGTLLKLSKSWFQLNELQRKLLEADKEKMDIELRGLRSQINPHFFFNTLNGLYALSLQQNPLLPASILQLSGLMRYFIYDSKAETVSLEQEINMLKDYIGLMNLRTENEGSIQFKVSGDPELHNIAPLIFICFIENAFKHGFQPTNKKISIDMNLNIEDACLHFSIINDKGMIVEDEFKNSEGIGLENVKRRLSLLYPGKHKLDIKETENKYVVELEIVTR